MKHGRVRPVRLMARWTPLSAALAPVFLIGGWTLAAARQPEGFDPVVATISALAGRAATDRWVMTAALVGLGLSHMATAFGMRAAAPAGRLVHALGGAATLFVAGFPLPRQGSSPPHTLFAAVSFLALAVWPVLAVRWAPADARDGARNGARNGARGGARGVPWGLRPVVAAGASVVLLALVGWFAVELYAGHHGIGLAERVAAGAEALWPLIVVGTARPWRSTGRAGFVSPGAADPRVTGRGSG